MTLHTNSLLFGVVIASLATLFSYGPVSVVDTMQLYCLAFIMNVVATKWT